MPRKRSTIEPKRGTTLAGTMPSAMILSNSSAAATNASGVLRSVSSALQRLLCVDLPVFPLLPEELVLREYPPHHVALHVYPPELMAQPVLLIHESQQFLLSLLEAQLQWAQEHPAEHLPPPAPTANHSQHPDALQAVPNLPQCLNCHSVHCPDTAAHPVAQILLTLHVPPSSLLFISLLHL